MELVPPESTLAINGAILPWNQNIVTKLFIRSASVRIAVFVFNSFKQLKHAIFFVLGTCYNNISEVGSKDKTDVSSTGGVPSSAIGG